MANSFLVVKILTNVNSYSSTCTVTVSGSAETPVTALSELPDSTSCRSASVEIVSSSSSLTDTVTACAAGGVATVEHECLVDVGKCR